MVLSAVETEDETKTEEEEVKEDEHLWPVLLVAEARSTSNDAADDDEVMEGYYFDVENGGGDEGEELNSADDGGGYEDIVVEDFLASSYDEVAANDNDSYDDDGDEEEEDQLPPMASELISSSGTASHASTSIEDDRPHQDDAQSNHHRHRSSILFQRKEGGGGKQARRISLVTDLSTGKAGGARIQNVRVRSNSLTEPQGSARRLRNSILEKTKSLRKIIISAEVDRPEPTRHGRYMVARRQVAYCSSDDEDESDTDEQRQVDVENPPSPHRHRHHRPPIPTQYCLRSVRKKDAKARLWAWLGVSDTGNIFDDVSGDGVCSCFGLSPNALVTRYLHWTFRSSFMAVFLSGALAYLSATMLFAVFIYSMYLTHPTCLGGVESEQQYFTDCFHLSWSTFATVGYGVVYPSVSANQPDIMKCTGMTIVLSMEAFIGVLYGCFCGAILFIKVSRIQSHAQVIFSDPIVVRYGTGVMTCDDAEDTKSFGSADGSVSDSQEIPCPVLEFRLVNRLNWVQGGELLDASMSIVACIDASQICKTIVQNAVRSRRHGKNGKNKGRGGPRTRKGGPGLLRARSQAALKRQEKNNMLSNKLKKRPPHSSAPSIKSLLRSQQELVSRKFYQEFEEDPGGSFVPRKVFSKLEVESPDHPYFKRSWTVSHKLDQYSPLLKTSAREAIKNHGGFWPPKLNTAEGVRSSIHFDQILVSFSGTSNADANSVYAQKVYDFVDMNIGYRFANLLYRDANDGSVHVDHRLINDVVEQCGGGGEDLANKPTVPVCGSKDSPIL